MLAVVLSWEISIKQQQNIHFKSLKKLNNQPKFDSIKHKKAVKDVEALPL